MFTPSVTRVVPAAARDWSYVDGWLSSIYPGHQVPAFERNAETLKALLTLAAFNETAQEDQHQLDQANNQALNDVVRHRDLDTQLTDPSPLGLRATLLDIIEHDLSNEGKVALDAIANASVRADDAFVSPEQLGAYAIETQSAIYDAEQMAARVQALESQIQREAERIQNMAHIVGQRADQTPSSLARVNMELERSVKMLSNVVKEKHGNATSNVRDNTSQPHITIDDLVREEQEYLALLDEKGNLDEQVSVFRGLPSDPERARKELESLQHQLHGVTTRRDAAFEGLVERESPAKRR